MLLSSLLWVPVDLAVEALAAQPHALPVPSVRQFLWSAFWRGEFDAPNGEPQDWAAGINRAKGRRADQGDGATADGVVFLKPTVLVDLTTAAPIPMSRTLMLAAPGWHADRRDGEDEAGAFQRLESEFLGIAERGKDNDGGLFWRGYVQPAMVGRAALVAWLRTQGVPVPPSLESVTEQEPASLPNDGATQASAKPGLGNPSDTAAKAKGRPPGEYIDDLRKLMALPGVRRDLEGKTVDERDAAVRVAWGKNGYRTTLPKRSALHKSITAILKEHADAAA